MKTTNNLYLEENVDKILKDTKLKHPLNLAMAAAWIIGNMKGLNIKILDIQSESNLTDYFILTSASNNPQATAIADTITTQFKRNGYLLLSSEGREQANWILLDYKDIMIHIFMEHIRDTYQLETLWKNAILIPVPTDYYLTPANGEILVDLKKEKKDYF